MTKKRKKNTHRGPVNEEQPQPGKNIRTIQKKVKFQNQTLFQLKSQLLRKRRRKRRKVKRNQRKRVGDLACMEKAAIGTQ